jgi:hypothetical protein
MNRHGKSKLALMLVLAAEPARQAAAAFDFIVHCQLLIGAFIASVAGAFGGYHRDEV